ncbi:MAG: ATP-binding protein [Thaumarchaeota archaeon]|nr:ATP-binding protein [Nitrososphaerota archaeon]
MEPKISGPLSTASLVDGDHLAVSYTDESKLASEISDFINRGTKRNQTNVLLVTSDEAERYLEFLREVGTEVNKLLSSGDLVIEPIDALLDEKQPVNVAKQWVAKKVAGFGDSARVRRKTGLNILGSIAGNLVKQGRYEECLSLEQFWHEFILRSDIPITLLCPYDAVPPELELPLQEAHTTVTRIVRGSREEIQQFMTAVIQRAASDQIEPVNEIVQDRSGLIEFQPFAEFIARMREAYPEFRARIITSVDGSNFDIVKELEDVGGFEVRHIEKISAKFCVTRTEYLGTARSLEGGKATELIWSNSAAMVSQMRNLFEVLWESAVPAALRISELEGGQELGNTRLTFDTNEIMKSANKFVEEATQEALILSSREGGIIANMEFFEKVKSKAREGVEVRILGRFSKEDAAILEDFEREGVQVRKLGTPRELSLSLGIYDRKGMGLVQYIASDDKEAPNRAYLSGIISTNRQTISGIIALFENLWEESEMRQRAELMKDILTHDVRNYNMIARANAELLEGCLEDKRQLEFARSILKAIDCSTELIQRTRTLGELISSPRAELRPMNLDESFERSLSLIRDARPDKRISISPRSIPHAQVLADELLDQLFVNILSNAVKHTEGSEILLAVGAEEREDPQGSGRRCWKITVTDQGKGMPDYVKESASMRYLGALKGRGLGLSIVRALVVERYSGRIQFRNRVDDDWTKGTKVEVWLPKAY